MDASEFIGSLPYSLTDRIVLGKKDTSVFLLDGRTGELVTRYRVDDLYTTNSVVQDGKDKAIVLSKEAPVVLGQEHLPEMVYLERRDFKLQCVSKFGDVLWSVSYAEMEAKLQHHESVQLIGGGGGGGLSMVNATVMRFRDYNFEKLFPRVGFLDGALYLAVPDRKQNQLAPGNGNPLALPSNKEAEQVLSLPLAETTIHQITDGVDRSTTKTGFASKLIVLLIGFCVSVLSVCGLVFRRIRQSKWNKEPSVSEVPIVTPKKKKPKKNGTVKAAPHKKNGGSKDLSFKENEKKLRISFPDLNNNALEGYRVGKLFVSNKEIAKGSNGTVVLEGSYEGRLVAVKRLVQTHHDVAQKEILNLMASDKHPNIVRWYAVDQDEHFIYISLERCACSLNDLVHASSGLLESPTA